MNNLETFSLVLIGGGIGSVLRWLVGLGVGESHKGGFPFGTFIVNATGAFLIGFISVLFNVDWRDRYGSNVTAFVLTGVLGGYTTFSSYQLDTATLYNKQKRGTAAMNWIGSVAVGLLAAGLGAWIARLLGS